jgi:1,2-diacylglycerol 3-beta-galactosyltransferase
MNNSLPERPRILFLFSDTGGGHRSAAEAIIEALGIEFDGLITTQMVDIFKEYAPKPLNIVPHLYPKMARLPQAWGLGYKLSNGHYRSRLITASAWPYVRHSIRNLIAQHPSDLIVSVHPLANAPVLRALGHIHPPFITMVTDLVTTHALWYHRRVDLCIVPTEAARQRALMFGLREEQVRVVGLPVADHFCQALDDRRVLRNRFAWPDDRLMILLVGGGEGMGPLEETAHAVANSGLPISLAIIAGRNRKLQARLRAESWPAPTFVYGFVKEMPDFMRAADVLVTKAGPGTISEALNAGLPMILYSRLPGQEDGNISYVVSEGAGVWAPHPDQIVFALSRWVKDPDKRLQAVQACQRLARPQAAREIAQILASRVGIAQGIHQDFRYRN